MPDDIKNISLADLVPDSIKDDKKVSAAIRAIDDELQTVSKLCEIPALFDRIDELDHDVLDHLAWQLRVDVWHAGLSLQNKRDLVRQSIAWHKYKGTVWAVRHALIWAGFGDAEILEHKHLVQSWMDAGGALLDAGFDIDGENDLAAPSGEFKFMTSHWAHFGIRANAADIELTPGEQGRIRQMVEVSKPARSHLVGLEFYTLYQLYSRITLENWAAQVRAVFDKCAGAQVHGFETIGWGCREIGGVYADDYINGRAQIDGWADIDGLRPDGLALDDGHWGTYQADLHMPAYTQAAGGKRDFGNILDPDYREIIEQIDGSRDLAVQTIDGDARLTGKLDLSVRPLVRQTYNMIDGTAHLGALPGPEAVWHAGHVDFWHGNYHYREAI
jgi:phage tail P2-like protein